MSLGKKCPKCGKIIDYRSKQCKNCHLKKHQKQIKTCKFCGKIITNFYAERCYDCFNKQRKIAKPIVCRDCGKILNTRNRKQKRCWDCWKQYIKVKDKFCVNCNRNIAKYHKSQRCYSCETKRRFKYGILNNKGKNNPAWQGGISFEPYSFKFNQKLKSFIRHRDNYICQKCELKEKNHYIGKRKTNLIVHHIDYNKQNCKETNLITLCNKCNLFVNSNRDYYYAYFNYIIKYYK